MLLPLNEVKTALLQFFRDFAAICDGVRNGEFVGIFDLVTEADPARYRCDFQIFIGAQSIQYIEQRRFTLDRCRNSEDDLFNFGTACH